MPVPPLVSLVLAFGRRLEVLALRPLVADSFEEDWALPSLVPDSAFRQLAESADGVPASALRAGGQPAPCTIMSSVPASLASTLLRRFCCIRLATVRSALC